MTTNSTNTTVKYNNSWYRTILGLNKDGWYAKLYELPKKNRSEEKGNKEDRKERGQEARSKRT